MKTSKSLALLSTAIVTLALTACGGGGGGDAGSGSTTTITTISVAGMVKFMTDIMGMTSETTSPNNTSTTELAVDETSEPATI